MKKLYEKIASGSSGNCIIYFEELMVDVGVAYKKVSDFLPSVKNILFTHKHTDHINVATVRRIGKEYPEIKMYGNEEVMPKLEEAGIKNRYEIKAGESLWIGEDLVFIHELNHDVLCYGFTIERKVNERILYLDNFDNEEERTLKIFHATDTFDLKGIEAKDCDAYFVEFNHCEEIISNNIEYKMQKNRRQGKNNFIYELNAQQYHNSNQRIMKWLSKNNVDGLVIPMHVSNKNNTSQEIDKLKDRIEFLYGGE